MKRFAEMWTPFWCGGAAGAWAVQAALLIAGQPLRLFVTTAVSTSIAFCLLAYRNEMKDK